MVGRIRLELIPSGMLGKRILAVVALGLGSVFAQSPEQLFDYMLENQVGLMVATYEQGFTLTDAASALGFSPDEVFLATMQSELVFAKCIRPIEFVTSGTAASIGLSETRLQTVGMVGVANDLSFLATCDTNALEGIRPRINVWTVGDDYPVAYHLEAEFDVLRTAKNGFEITTAFAKETLGYAPASSARSNIETWIRDVIQEFAGAYLRTVPSTYR